MPAGSGPMAVAASTGAVATSETVIATLTGNWNEGLAALGAILSAFLIVTASGAANLTLRIRQASLTGVQVGQNAIVVFGAAATTSPVSISFLDATAFGLGPTAGQYVLTVQASVASTITVNGGFLELETVAPVS